LRPENAAAAQAQPQAGETTVTKQLTDEEFDQFVDQHAAYFINLYDNVKLELIKKGYDMSKYPEINAFLDNPIPGMKQIRRDPSFSTQWGSLDAKLNKKK
jgi:hypothetical protein